MRLLHRPLTFYGLLHVALDELGPVNARNRQASESLRMYLRNALLLARSLRMQHLPFVLLTNQPDTLEACAREEGYAATIQAIPFPELVPKGTLFYSAHHKINVFRWLGTRAPDAYSILVDIDVICAKSLPAAFIEGINAGIPAVYEIGAQVHPAFGRDVVIRDLTRLTGKPSTGLWYGGEFIGGTAAFFGSLSDRIAEILPRYLGQISGMHHVGDEILTSAALELLIDDGLSCMDGGTRHAITRFWNRTTLHAQAPVSRLDAYSLLHLPADKELLARTLARSDAEILDFSASYQRACQALLPSLLRSGPGRALLKLRRQFA